MNHQKSNECIASKSNKIQIELYLEYLIETMDKLADEAKNLEVMEQQEQLTKQIGRKDFLKRLLID